MASALRGVSPEDLYAYWTQNVKLPASQSGQEFPQFNDWINQSFAGPSMPSVNNLGRDYAIGGSKTFDKPLLGLNDSGQAERIYQDTGPIQGWQDVIGNYFASDPNRPDTAQAALAGGKSFNNPKMSWDEIGVIAGLAAMTGGALGPALGAATGLSTAAAGGSVAGATAGGIRSNWDPEATATGGVLGGAGGAIGGSLGGTAGGEASAAAGGTGGSSSAAASGGTGMWDWLDEFVSPGDAGDVGTYGTSGIESAPAPTGLAGDQPLDIFGSTPDMPGWTNDASTWDPQYSQPGGGSSLWGKIADWAKGALPNARSLFGGGSAAAGGSAPGGMGFGTAAFDSAPFLLSLGLANKQRNDINPYLDRLNSLYDRFSSNEGGYLKSVTDPYDMATAQQHGALTTSLGNRGVLGSSFGDMSLDNQNYMRDVGRGDLLSRAINESVGAQSQLTDQAMKGINTRNAASNALLGAGLNASARLFSPQQDPFGLRTLMGGY